ncbi:hypothetical protein ACFL1D_04635 [Candidatus Omnitrophota bacterium]
MKKSIKLGLNIADVPIQIEIDDIGSFSHVSSTLGSYIKPINKPYFYMRVNKTSGHSRFHKEDEIKIIQKNDYFAFRNKKSPVYNIGFIEKADRFCQLDINPASVKILFYPFLLSAFSLFLSELDSFIVHAAGIIYKGLAYIFIGPSGSGKTTVARILQKKGLNIISDERIIIRKRGSCFMAYAMPWFNDRDQSAPLKSIFLLKKSKRVTFIPLKSSYAVSQILPNVYLNLPDQEAIERLLDTFQLLLSKCRLYEMEFLPDSSFWQGVKGLN